MGLDPGDESMGWDIEDDFDPEGSGWAERVHTTIPNLDEDEMVLLRRLEKKIDKGHAAEMEDPIIGSNEVVEGEQSGFVGPLEA